MVVAPGPNDSYSSIERRLKAPLERVTARLLGLPIAVLCRLGVPPNAVSALQVLLALAFFYTLPREPRWSLLLWLASLLCDSLDGLLARCTGRASAFGALWDQTCDHVREVLIVAALAHHGAASPLWATLYAFTYPAFNLALMLCNRHGVPLQVAIKSYLVLYPALIAYLGWGVNFLSPALAIATLAMAVLCGVALGRLHKAM